MGTKYLTYPGKHDESIGLLPRGYRSAQSVAVTLLDRELGETAFILTSSDLAAEQAARHIGELLTDRGRQRVEIVSNSVLEAAGRQPNAVKNLDGLLGGMLVAASYEVSEGQPLVVVTHPPLIRACAGMAPDAKLSSSLFTEVEAWVNPEFSSEVAREVFGPSNR